MRGTRGPGVALGRTANLQSSGTGVLVLMLSFSLIYPFVPAALTRLWTGLP